MFDKLMGSLSRKAERKSQEKAARAARDLQEKLRVLTGACSAVIRARETRGDPFAAIEQSMRMGWAQFVTFVNETAAEVGPEETDPKAEMLSRHATVRKIAPAFLEAFEFKATPSAKPILDAIDTLRTMYRSGQRTLPDKPPVRFIRRVWRPLVIKGGEIDRKAYELCAFFELRDRLRAGDIWIEGSRQYQSFESELIPEPTFSLLKAEGPLPIAIDTNVETYLAGRRAALDRELEDVGKLAEQGKLDGVDLTGGELVISPVQASTPPEAEKLKETAYALLPATKITDVLLEVDAWTNFTSCFTHQRNGRPCDNKPALLSAVLADGINLGLNRMADALRGITYRQLALAHDWHIREESYRAALARLIDAHRVLPLAEVWGEGRTSSSDGQYFRAGGTGAAIADVNARHGNEPGVSFYTHISDQFGPFYTKVIAATASEAPHVLDGLLYHDTGLRIEEHYTDTGGVTDHVFGLCHLFGFRFAPRIRDIKERKLYLLPEQKAPASLKPIVGGVIDIEHVTAHWDELLRLATSIRTGTTTSSAILKKLSAYPRQNGLAKALREVGRIERTLFTLDWIKNPAAAAGASRPQQRRGTQCTCSRRLLLPARRDARPELREPILPRVRAQSLGRCDHPLEHAVSGGCLWRAPGPRTRDRRHAAPARRAARLGAHRPDRRLRLERRGSASPRCTQAAASAPIVAGRVSSINVPDVVHSEHFRVVTPTRRSAASRPFSCSSGSGMPTSTPRRFTCI